MDRNQFKITALELIRKSNFEDLFNLFSQNLLPSSTAFQEIHALNSRFTRLGQDRRKGILSLDQEILEENKITNHVIELLDLVGVKDLRVQEVPKTIEILANEIRKSQDELRNIANDQGKGLIALGENMEKLGQLLSGQGANPDIPFEEYLEAGSLKAKRRLKEAFSDLKKFRLIFLNCFKGMIKSYENLVSFLDTYPSKEISEQEAALLEKLKEELSGYEDRLRNKGNVEEENIAKSIEFFDIALEYKEKAPANMAVIFLTVEEIRKYAEDMLEYTIKNERELKALLPGMKTLILELQINLQEARM